jgi:hypothetical protein
MPNGTLVATISVATESWKAADGNWQSRTLAPDFFRKAGEFTRTLIKGSE